MLVASSASPKAVAAPPPPSSSGANLLSMPLVAVPEGTLVAAKDDYLNYRSRVDQLKAHFNAAVRKEQDAYARVQLCQQKVRESLTDPQVTSDSDLLVLRQRELANAEEMWRHSTLFTAELRAEITDLAKQRDGDYSDEVKFCGLHSLDRAKPVPLKVEDIDKSPKKLIRAAYPVVDPRVQYNEASPHARINEDAFLEKFRALDSDRDGFVSEEQMIHALDQINDFGIPNHSRTFIHKTLSKFGSPMTRGHFINYDQFVVIMLKFIEL